MYVAPTVPIGETESIDFNVLRAHLSSPDFIDRVVSVAEKTAETGLEHGFVSSKVFGGRVNNHRILSGTMTGISLEKSYDDLGGVENAYAFMEAHSHPVGYPQIPGPEDLEALHFHNLIQDIFGFKVNITGGIIQQYPGKRKLSLSLYQAKAVDNFPRGLITYWDACIGPNSPDGPLPDEASTEGYLTEVLLGFYNFGFASYGRNEAGLWTLQQASHIPGPDELLVIESESTIEELLSRFESEVERTEIPEELRKTFET